MSEALTEMDWFRHFHQAAATELTVIIKNHIDRPTDVTQQKLVAKHQETLDGILSSVNEEKFEPTSVFQKGLTALANMDKERFLIENLLEAVKRGESLRDTVGKYRTLGLTDIDVSQVAIDVNNNNDGAASLPPSSVGAGKLLGQFLHKLKKVSTKLMQLVINAMKAIPKFIGIKPSIGFSGPFPILSLQFDLQTESITLHELFQDLTKGLTSESPAVGER